MSKAWIPNTCTSLNLVFGMLSIFALLLNGIKIGSFVLEAPVCILLALVADGLDGRLARYFGTVNELGKEMDSLCDVISFGVAPGLMSFFVIASLIQQAAVKLEAPPANLQYFVYFCMAAGIIYAVCGMWRLARFNINVGIVHGYFMGLPIPAGGCLIASAAMLQNKLPFILPITAAYIAPVVVIFIGFLMVSNIHYPDFKGEGEKINIIALILSLTFALGVIFLCRSAFAYAILFAVFSTYAIFGILNTFFNTLSS